MAKDMHNTGITVEKEVIKKFDRKIALLEAQGVLETNTSRTEVIRDLMEEWAEGNLDSPSNEKAAIPA